MRARIVLLLLIGIATNGCASLQRLLNSDGLSTEERREKIARDRQEAEQAERAKRDALCNGKTEDAAIMSLGAPTKVDTAGSFKIFQYYEDRGTSVDSRAGVIPVGYGNAIGVGSSEITRHYRLFKLYFKDGFCVKWEEEWR